MLVYLDNCCYNRPFDEQAQVRVRLETEAKMRLQSLMRTGAIDYAWSSVLEYEIGKSPFFGRIKRIRPSRLYARGESHRFRFGGNGMKTMTDSELQVKCFRALVDTVGYYGTERFIVLMNRAPGDYTAWHEAQCDDDETIEELGAKIMAYDRNSTPCEMAGAL